jgi:hypothetical protein
VIAVSVRARCLPSAVNIMPRAPFAYRRLTRAGVDVSSTA